MTIALRRWLPLATAIVAVLAVAYALVQQVERAGANDPQIQMAEDAAAALDAGRTPAQVGGPAVIEMSRDLAPFVLVYDRAGQLVFNGAVLDGAVPHFPEGALRPGEGRVTWQPRAGVRLAAVSRSYSAGFVVAARSLREVEARIDALTMLAAIGTLGALLVSFAAALVVAAMSDRATTRSR